MKKEITNYFIRKAEISVEETENDKYIIGLIPFDSKSERMKGRFEVITPSAFNKTIEDGANVYAFYNHDDSLVLGSTKSGTLELSITDKGLVCKCKVIDTDYSRNAYTLVRDGIVKTMSFGFIPLKVREEADTDFVTEAKLIEVSFCVAFPAYSETTSETRTNEEVKNMLDEILNKEELTDDEKSKLVEYLEKINSKLSEKTEEEVEEKPADEPEVVEEKSADEITEEPETKEEEITDETEAEPEEKEEDAEEIDEEEEEAKRSFKLELELCKLV